ncbi:autotransporter-associated beta strand repeat-containing protein [Sphingomonas sp. MMS24-J45]|uniref:autotransporter-associated beta strand repeat-containing protein n=1 Tax=Sphingomonas sp. MMS24-J45 TaxID=3238806 RepID=UPI00384D7150
MDQFQYTTLTVGGDDTSFAVNSFDGGQGSSLRKIGAGTFTVAGAFETVGSIGVYGGTLQIGDGVTAGQPFLLHPIGGSGDTNGIIVNGTLAFNRPDNIGIDASSQPITGTGNLVQRGTGTLTLSGENTYSGLTTVERGTLVAASNGALGSSAGGTVVQDGATLAINSGVFSSEAITINGTGVGGLGALRALVTGSTQPFTSGVGSITLGSDATIGFGSPNSNAPRLNFSSLDGAGHALTTVGQGGLSGPMSNLSALNVNGTFLSLYGANVAAPIFVNSGVLNLWEGNAVGDTTRVNLASGTTLNVVSTETIGSVNGPGSVSISAVGQSLTLGGDNSSFAVTDFTSTDNTTLRKIGSGTFKVTGNYYQSSSLELLAGTLQIGDGGSGGFLVVRNPDSGGSNLINGTLAFNRSDNITLSNANSAAFTGTGNLIQRGTGTLTLSGANTYAGLTTVERGTLVAASNGALGSSAGGTLVQDGATLVVNGGVFNSEAITINGSGVGGLGALRFAGTNIGVGTITLGSDARIGFDVRGDINLAGVVGNGHDLTIGSASVLNLGGGQMTGLGSLTYEAGAHALINATVDGPVFLQSGVTLQTSGLGGVTFGRVNVAAGSQLGAVAATNAGSIDGLGHVNVTGPLTVGRDNSSTTIGSITVNDYTTLTKVGTGTLTVAGSYQATNSNTVIEAGTLQIGDGGATGTILFGDPSIGPAPIIVNGTLAFNRSDDISLGGYVAPISGTGNLIQRGTGTLTLMGSNTYSGGTIVEAGTLSTGGGAALGSGAVTVLDGATLRLTGATFANPMILNGAGAGGNGALQLVPAGFGTYQLGAISLGSDATIGFGTSDPTLQTATLNGGGHALTVTGFGGLQGFATNLSALNVNGSQLRLFNTNIDAPIFVNSGTLLTNGNGIGDFSRVNLSAGTTLTVGNDETIGSVDGPGRILLSGNRTLTVGGDNSSSAIMTFDSNENSTLRKTGTGTFTILGGYDQMGGLQIDQGTLQIGNGGAIGPIFLGLSGQNVVNGTLAINRSDTITMGTDNPAFTGSGTIAQSGSGTLALGGNSVGFTGTVSVEAGTLSLGGTFGDQAGNSARLVVSDGGTLAGTGTFLGNATIATGGTLRPGNSPGTITFSSLTLDAGSHSVFELSQAGVVGGARNDLVRVTGNLALNGGNITIARGAGFSTGQYTLFQYGSLTGTLRNLTLDPLGGGFGGNLALGTGAVLLNVAGAADQVYWNGNTTNPAGSIVGGSGTWNLLDGNFSNASGTVSGAWAGNNALAIFGGAAGGTVTIAPDTFLSPSGLNFRTDGYVIAGANLGSGLLLNGATGIDTATGVGATISAPISGSGSVTKTGAGTLTLAGTNSYSGSTTILGGTLVNTGTVAGDVANYATLISSGTVQGGLTNNSGAIANLSGTLTGTVSNAGTITAIGNLASNGTFDNTTTGLAAVNAGATWSGLRQVTNAGTADNAFAINGTLSVAGQFFNTAGARLAIGTGGSLLTAPTAGSAGLLNETGALVVNAGTINSSIDNSGFFTSTGTLTGQLVNNQGANATLSGAVGVIRNVGALTVNGNLVGTGTIDNRGTGTLTVNAGATWTGTTAISNNSKAANGFIVNGTLGTTGSFTNAAGASLTIATAGTLNVGGSINNAATARITNAGNIAGPVSNNGSLISTGAINGGLTNAAGATSALQGSLGGSVNNSGTVTLTGATAGITTVTQTSTGAFDLAGFDTTIGGLAGSGSVTLGTGTLTLGSDGRSTSFDGSISGAGGLLKNGAGTLTLSGVNTFTGETRIDAGGLTLAAGGVIAGPVRNGAALVNAGTVSGLVVSTGDFLSSGIVQGGLTQSGGTARVSGTLNGTINSAGTLTVDGILTSNGPAQTSGAGLTQILGGARWSGLTAFTNASTNATGLRIAGALDVSGIVTTQAGATTVIADGSSTLTASAIATFGALTSAGTVNGDVTNAGTITNTGTWNGNLSQGTGNTTNAAQWNGAFRIDAGGTVTNTGNWTNATGFRSMVGAGLFENFGTLSGGVTASGTTALLANRTGGTITLASGSVLAADTGGTITNAGSIVGDVQVLAGGNVSNLAGGTWRGSATVTTGGRFTNAGTVNGDVTNTGTITNTGIWNGNLSQGTGNTTNAAQWNGAFRIDVGGTITNAGSIVGDMEVLAGGNVSNLAGGTWRGSATVTTGGRFASAGTVNGDATNAGTITNTGTWNGNLSQGTGNTTNAAQWNGVFRIDAGGTVTNTGNWTNATGFRSVVGAGLFENFGTLSGGGVTASGTTAVLANRTGGTISLANGVVLAADTGGTITNAGSIVGDVQVLAGGIVNNVAGGTWRGSATVTTGGRFTNAGSITGAIGNSGILASSGTIVGNLTNYTGGTATLQGSLRGSVTNGGSITLTGLTTEITALAQSASGSFDLAGFNTTLGALEGSGTILLRAGTLTVDTSTADTIFGGVIGGSGGLIKTGDRTLTLSGANGFTGPTVINGGTLVVAQGASLSGPVTNNTTFVNGGSITGPVTNNGNAVSIGTLDGGLSNGAGAVAQLANTVRGTIGNAGAITLIGDLTGGPAMTQVTSGSLDLAGFNATIGSLAGNGSVALGSGTLALGGDGSSTSFGGVISGTGALVKNGAGTLTLSGPNSFIGQTWITAGGVTLASGGVLVSQVNNTATFTNGGTVSAPVANGSTFVSTGIINGGLYNYADGTVRLAGQMNGDITNAGSVTLTGATSGIGNVTQFATGSIDLAGVSTTFGSLAGNGVIKLGSAELTVGSNAVDTRFDGAITGSGSLVKTGSGLLLLGGVNSFAGRTTVGAGSLMLASGGALAGSVTNLATFSNAGTVSGPVTNGGRLGSTGALNGGLTNLANSSALLSGSVTGPFSNAGILLVASGTTLSAAPLANTGQVQNAGRWTGDITSSAGALFDNTATGTIVGALDNRGTLLSAGTINGRLVNSGGARLAGTIIGPILNTGEILTSGTLGVTGDVTNTGLFTVGTGTFTTSGAFNNAGALVVNADATLSLGSGTLRNSGSAALIDVAGTLRGRIDLASGGLIGRSGSLLAGDVTIASGASFMSGGTVTGTATINGTLMPGNSPGTLTINGALALGGSSTTIFEMTNGTSDRIVVNGTASIASGATLIVTGVRKATPGQTYSLLSTTGGITGSFTTIAKDSRVFGFIRQSANSIDLLGTLTLPTGANARGTAIVNYLNDRLVAGTVTDPGLALTSSLAQLDGTPIAPLVARISPEPYASAGSMALETGLALAKTVRATPLVMRDRDRAGLFVFLQGFATGRDVAARPSGVAAANQAGEGYFGGVGYGTATLGLSAFVGRSTVRQDIAELGAQTRSRGTFFGARLHAATGGVRFNASAILDRSDSDTGRSPITGATQGRYTLRGETFDAEIAYDLPLGNGRFAIRPSAGVTHTRATRGGIAETGGGAAALTVAAQSYQATWINGEIALSASGTSKVQPWIGLGVRYMANGDPILATGTLAGFGGQFTVEGARAPRTIGHASGGVSFALARGLSAYLAGEVDVTRTGGARQIQGGIRFAF